MCRNCYTEDQTIDANAYYEGTEDAYVPTPAENAAKGREYLAYARERFGHAFYIEPNGYGIRVQCKGCGQSATGQFANTMLYEHICFQ